MKPHYFVFMPCTPPTPSSSILPSIPILPPIPIPLPLPWRCNLMQHESAGERAADWSAHKVIWCGRVFAPNELQMGWRWVEKGGDLRWERGPTSRITASSGALRGQFLVCSHGDGLIRANENTMRRGRGWSISLKHKLVIFLGGNPTLNCTLMD